MGHVGKEKAKFQVTLQEQFGGPVSVLTYTDNKKDADEYAKEYKSGSNRPKLVEVKPA